MALPVPPQAALAWPRPRFPPAAVPVWRVPPRVPLGALVAAWARAGLPPTRPRSESPGSAATTLAAGVERARAARDAGGDSFQRVRASLRRRVRCRRIGRGWDHGMPLLRRDPRR